MNKRLVALLMVAASVLPVASRSRPATPATTADAPDTPFVGHVHGLGVDPADRVLYVAAHGGVFRLTDARLQLVANRAQDTMGFTVVGPRHFLASGHPVPTDLDQPNHLGLIESRDATTTRTTKSLSGQADFHSLEPGPGVLSGYDSQSGTVMRTAAHTTWTAVMSGQVHDLAARPTRADELLAATGDGVVRLTGTKQSALNTPAQLSFLDWPSADLLVGATAKGAVYRSPDGGLTWNAAGQLPGHVEAFTAERAGWYAATEQGIFTSADRGGSWTQIL